MERKKNVKIKITINAFVKLVDSAQISCGARRNGKRKQFFFTAFRITHVWRQRPQQHAILQYTLAVALGLRTPTNFGYQWIRKTQVVVVGHAVRQAARRATPRGKKGTSPQTASGAVPRFFCGFLVVFGDFPGIFPPNRVPLTRVSVRAKIASNSVRGIRRPIQRPLPPSCGVRIRHRYVHGGSSVRQFRTIRRAARSVSSSEPRLRIILKTNFFFFVHHPTIL